MFLVIGGVALIGTLAATLGAFFSGGGDEDVTSTTVDLATDSVGATDLQHEMLLEVRSIRAEIAEMRRSVGGQSG